jgi:cytochrome c biogenesis protein CcdA/thiol-disulfide isomerase/thioredoxin
MLILLGFAFLAGIFTALSPCILPVLPAILAAGTAQGKMRPFGTVLGLVLSFSFFTLALTSIVHATGVSPNFLRWVAIALIFLFGLVMVSEKLSLWFAKITTPIADLGQRLQGKATATGFWSGLMFGVALGLLWTPCAGPILAAITTLAATGAVSFTAVLLTLSYSVGAGIPMFLFAYGGNKLVQSSHFLSRHSERIRQFFGCLMIVFAVVLAFNWDMLLQEKLARLTPAFFTEKGRKLEEELGALRGHGLTIGSKAPEITGIAQWINSPPLTLEELKGKVVLIDFWTYSCINCLRTLPYLKNWYADYKNEGFVIIGVHTPEFVFEKNFDNVSAAVKHLGIEYPVALDNDYKTWQAYHNNYWPAHYLIDQNGIIRMVHYGEGSYVETENAIRELLGMSPIEMKEPEQNLRPLTPETYLGKNRGHPLINYTPPLGDNEIGLKGSWTIEDEYILANGDDCYLDLNFLAKQVYLVLGGSSPNPIQVYLDGKLSGTILVDMPRKYDVVSTTYGRHQLSLKVPAGIQAYAFTFGDEN